MLCVRYGQPINGRFWSWADDKLYVALFVDVRLAQEELSSDDFDNGQAAASQLASVSRSSGGFGELLSLSAIY